MTQVQSLHPAATLSYSVIDPRLAEEVFAGLFCDEAELFEFKICALDFASVDREFLREGGGRRKRFARSHSLVSNLSLDLFADLRVYGIVRQVFQLNVHS